MKPINRPFTISLALLACLVSSGTARAQTDLDPQTEFQTGSDLEAQAHLRAQAELERQPFARDRRPTTADRPYRGFGGDIGQPFNFYRDYSRYVDFDDYGWNYRAHGYPTDEGHFGGRITYDEYVAALSDRPWAYLWDVDSWWPYYYPQYTFGYGVRALTHDRARVHSRPPAQYVPRIRTLPPRYPRDPATIQYHETSARDSRWY